MSLRNAVAAFCSFTLCFASAVCAQYGPYTSRGLLEKKLYYLDEEGKTGMCSFWSLYLGKHSCKLVKQFPGEGDVTLDAEVNFNFISSQYIEGKGFSSRGKVDAEGRFAVIQGDTVAAIEAEQIEYISDFGGKVKISGSEPSDLILLSQSNRLSINRMLLRIFKYDNSLKELDFEKDIAIKAFAFSKEDLQKAISRK